ncbi:MAG: type II toxin-antitoxin system VapB family antitoxin [Candidatus Riesia sp.]|nr:type II toxin-antitoxin system VapB family antitoxin [Candidatus Riesia sp.]
MTINLRNSETDKLIRKLAARRGVGLTEAVREAVEEALARDEESASQQGEALRERLAPLFARLDRLPRTGKRTDKQFFDEMWGQGDD